MRSRWTDVPVGAFGRRGSRSRATGGSEREPSHDRGAAPGGVFRPYLTAVSFNHCFGERKAEPRAPTVRAVGEEAFEDALEVFLRNATAAIIDFDDGAI